MVEECAGLGRNQAAPVRVHKINMYRLYKKSGMRRVGVVSIQGRSSAHRLVGVGIISQVGDGKWRVDRLLSELGLSGGIQK